jgi:hypothetical protein
MYIRSESIKASATKEFNAKKETLDATLKSSSSDASNTIGENAVYQTLFEIQGEMHNKHKDTFFKNRQALIDQNKYNPKINIDTQDSDVLRLGTGKLKAL